MDPWTIKIPDFTDGMAVYVGDPGARTRAAFEYESRFEEPVVLWRREGNRFLFPRAACPLGRKDLRTSGYAFPDPYEFTGSPRGVEQARVIGGVRDRLCAGDESFVVQASPGFGKTVCLLASLAGAYAPTLIVVTKSDLIEQWRERIDQFTDVGLEGVGIARQNVCDYVGKRFVVATVQSLAAGAEDGRYEAMRDYFGHVVFDEVHRLPAETWERAAGMFPARTRIGLSATPVRTDGKERTIQAHIGEVAVRSRMVSMRPNVRMLRTGWRVPRYDNGRQMRHEAGRTIGIDKIMSENAERNAKIVKLIHRAYEKGRRIVVFSSLRDHLTLMAQGVRALGVPGNEIDFYVGGRKKEELDKAVGRRVLFATYAMMKEGTDVPWLDCCFLTTPMANVEQVVGRVLREYPDKKVPVVVDFVDDDSPLFDAYAAKRRSVYRSIGAKVK